ncbi:MAG: hypothetical protein JNJ63_05330 [Hyphomonadaceae bacterium]|nr:hypothetical protein [Hyphomonadaceae bacterium]
MLRPTNLVRAAVAALVLALAACGQAPEQAAEEAPGASMSETSSDTPEAAPFCAEVGRRVSPADCADLGQLAATAEAGAAAFNAPDPMQRGDIHTLQLAISYAPPAPSESAAATDPGSETSTAELNNAGSVTDQLSGGCRFNPETGQSECSAPSPAPATPEEIVDPLQGETVQFTPLVGRFMRAELIGTGFEITPLTPASQEVLHDSVTTWSWRVVAQEGGQRTLTLRTVVEGCTADGQCYPLRSTSQNYDVHVTVGLLGQAQDVLTAAPTWLRLLAGVLTALAVLVGAWFGLRSAFRKGREAA